MQDKCFPGEKPGRLFRNSVAILLSLSFGLSSGLQAGTDPQAKPVIVDLYGGLTLTSYHPQSEEAVTAYLDKCAKYGVDQLSVNMFDVGAWSDHLAKNDPRCDELVTYAFKEAHKMGIKIYASIPIFGRSERDEKSGSMEMPSSRTSAMAGRTPTCFRRRRPRCSNIGWG